MKMRSKQNQYLTTFHQRTQHKEPVVFECLSTHLVHKDLSSFMPVAYSMVFHTMGTCHRCLPAVSSLPPKLLLHVLTSCNDFTPLPENFQANLRNNIQVTCCKISKRASHKKLAMANFDSFQELVDSLPYGCF